MKTGGTGACLRGGVLAGWAGGGTLAFFYIPAGTFRIRSHANFHLFEKDINTFWEVKERRQRKGPSGAMWIIDFRCAPMVGDEEAARRGPSSEIFGPLYSEDDRAQRGQALSPEAHS